MDFFINCSVCVISACEHVLMSW